MYRGDVTVVHWEHAIEAGGCVMGLTAVPAFASTAFLAAHLRRKPYLFSAVDDRESIGYPIIGWEVGLLN